MHAILNIMLIELDFLLDDKVTAEMQNEANPKERLLIKLNVLRKVLAVKDESEMIRLIMNIYQNARKSPEQRQLDESGIVEEQAAKGGKARHNPDMANQGDQDYSNNQDLEENNYRVVLFLPRRETGKTKREKTTRETKNSTKI